jgi:hypothetical protein
MSAIIRAVDKEFSLSANYPKGHGKTFLEWIREYYPGVLLLHVERAAGSRQDLCTEGSMAIYMNYPYYVEFLDNMLRKQVSVNDKPSILQQNLFVALTSREMIALSCLLSILHIAICLPFRWLAGKTHELKQYNDWGPISMSRVIDTLHDKMSELSTSPHLIEDENFMMNIFSEYLDEIVPFREYWEVTFEKKQMSVVARCRKDGTKVVHMARLRMELFSPASLTNIRTSEMLIVLAKTAARAIYDELRDESKATFKYLSVSGSEYSWNGCGEARKKALLGKKATNDEAESTLGGTTSNIQRYGRINISSAGAISDAKRNGFLQREYVPPQKKSSAKAQGIFQGLSEVLREVIVTVAMKDAPSTRKKNHDAIQLQATAQRMKVELFKGEKSGMCNGSIYRWLVLISNVFLTSVLER